MWLRIAVICLFINSWLGVKAQYQLGLRNSNFAGMYPILQNPAHLADSRYLVNVNVAFGNISAKNNFIQVETPYSQWGVLTGNLDDQFIDSNGFPLFSNSYLIEKLNGNKKFVSASAGVMGPSFMLNFKDLSGFAFYNRTRAVVHLSGINESLLKIYLEDLDTSSPSYSSDQNQLRYIDEALSQRNFGVGANAFQEFGFSYARVLREKKHFVKAGATVKYLVGLGAAYVKIKNLDYTLDDVDSIVFSNADMEYAYIDEDFYSRANPRLNDFFGDSKLGNGLALDVGVVYEFRPDYKSFQYKMNRRRHVDRSSNKYKYRLAASITDFGAIRYRQHANIRTIQQESATTGYSNFNRSKAWLGTDDVDSFMLELFPTMTSDSVFSARLPTALHIEADYHYQDNWYVSASYHQSLRLRQTSGVRYPRVVAITPRYESRWLTVSAPISVSNAYQPFQMGLCASVGFVHIGTDQLGGVFTGKKTNGFDLYGGITLPIHHNALKDADGDGVDDLTDACPDTPGSIRAGGCPDADDDRVPDADDWCPEIPGKKNTHGCPDPDGDFLVMQEDACPDQWGTRRNQGCPDSDDDGVHDGIDKCPDLYGAENMEGCPDRDNDGVHDGIDLCIDEPGAPDNEGCPIHLEPIHVDVPPPDTKDSSKPVVIEDPDPTTPPEKDPPKNNPFPKPPTASEPDDGDTTFSRFDFKQYDYFTILASYENLDLAKAFQKRLQSEAGLYTDIEHFDGSPYHYITTGKATTLAETQMMKESLSTPIVLKLINGRLWWKKIPKKPLTLRTNSFHGDPIAAIMMATGAGLGLMFAGISLGAPVVLSMALLIGGIFLVYGFQSGKAVYRLHENRIEREIARAFGGKTKHDVFPFSSIRSVSPR